jgi:vacuolar-type H+-ATPase catalytic subunit A/Vma1
VGPTFLLGYLLNVGTFGGCALIGTTMGCTFGAIADCTLETRNTCKVPVYTREVSSVDEAITLAAYVRDHDPKVLGPATWYAIASQITQAWTQNCRDMRATDQIRDGEQVCP